MLNELNTVSDFPLFCLEFMSIKLARISEAHHCVSWLTVHSVLQSLGPAPALQQRLWTGIGGPAAHWASSSRTPGHSCLAKLISGCLSELMVFPAPLALVRGRRHFIAPCHWPRAGCQTLRPPLQRRFVMHCLSTPQQRDTQTQVNSQSSPWA